MPENNFERRVQQKMEEFKLPPSDLVWLEVERRIRKEKRRRFIFWWFLLAILLAGGIGTSVWLGNKNEKKPGSATENITLHTTNTNTSAGDQPISRIRETKADTAMTNTITRANNQEPEPGIQPPVAPKDKTGINTPAVLKKEKQKKAIRSTAAVQPGNAMLAVDNGAGALKKKKDEANTKVSTVPVDIAGNPDTVMAIEKNVKPKPVATAIADTVFVNSPVLKDTTAIQLLAANRKDTSSIH
jgi:hypothetical protein